MTGNTLFRQAASASPYCGDVMDYQRYLSTLHIIGNVRTRECKRSLSSPVTGRGRR